MHVLQLPNASFIRGTDHSSAVHSAAVLACGRLEAGGAAAQERCSGVAGEVAEKLEAALGIPVLRHTEKKPAGGPQDLERHFGCAPAAGPSPRITHDSYMSLAQARCLRDSLFLVL